MFSADPASPTRYVSKCCITQNQVCTVDDVGHCTLPPGHGHVHTCGMDVYELTAVAIAAPLPPPWYLRLAQASTSLRRA